MGGAGERPLPLRYAKTLLSGLPNVPFGVMPHAEDAFAMFTGFFVAVAALTLSTPRPAATAGSHPRAAHTLLQRSHADSAEELYSLRARRRFAAYLRLRMLEWREEGLDRAAAVVEHRLSVDALVPGP